MSFCNQQLQVILQIYLSGNLSPFSEVYLYLMLTVTGQFVLTVCAFHGYALVGVLLDMRLCATRLVGYLIPSHREIVVRLRGIVGMHSNFAGG